MRTNRLLVLTLLLLAIALIVIGALQYRWLGRVSDAERQRMRRNLEFATERLAGELSTRVDRVFHTFMADEREDPAVVADEWNRQSDSPDLISAAYFADRDGESWIVRRLDPATQTLVDAPLPAALEPLRRELDNLTERGPQQHWPGPLFGRIPALFIVQLPPMKRDPGMRFAQPLRVIFVQLDREALGALTRERSAPIFDFAPGGVDVELAAGPAVLYRSIADMGPPDLEHEFRPFAPRREGPRPREGREPPPPPPEEMWQLRVRHHDGGLESIIAAAHRRNLAVAGLVLLVLATSSALLIVLLRRGERLRAQQQQFVAAMSHELNTPLAVLRVASENLNDGIAKDPEKVSRYVRTIARETAHLSEMVNHVLELAGMNAGVALAARESVDIAAVVQDAVVQSRSLVDSSAIDVDVEVADDLPPVGGNRQALTRAVQNLVTNAMRHAGAGKWVGVRAASSTKSVCIVVEDRGPGIAPDDAKHVFEPFFRGRGSSTVRGTGLGLTIVKQIVTEHGGTVTVERGRDGGAAFLIELPPEGVA